MKIQYTLPGIQFEQPRPVEGESSIKGPGVDASPRVSRLIERGQVSFSKSLGLERPHLSAGWIHPPTRPNVAEPWNAAGNRLRWKGMLLRQKERISDSTSMFRKLEGNEKRKEELQNVEAMATLLFQFEQMRDEMIARSLTDQRS